MEHSALLPQAGLTIHLLAQSIYRSTSSLHYRGGDCTWRVFGLLAQEVTVTGPLIELVAVYTTVEIVCEVIGTVLLQTEIISHGNSVTF